MATRNFHVPLSEELHAMQADSVDLEIAAYARAMAQTAHDTPATDGAAHLWELLKDDEW